MLKCLCGQLYDPRVNCSYPGRVRTKIEFIMLDMSIVMEDIEKATLEEEMDWKTAKF